MKSNSVFRIRVISGIISFIVIVLLSKLYAIQVVSGDDFRLKAERQYLHPNENTFNRGTIFFRNKDESVVGAAILKTGFTLSVNPKALENTEQVFEKINKIIPIDQKAFLAQAAKKDSLYAIIAKKVEEEAAKKIEALKINGVLLYKDRYRFYPSKSLAGNVLGLVGYKGNVLAGRYGLESYYDDTLSRNSSDLYSNFFAEIFSNIKKTVNSKSKFEGDILSAIEPTVQAFLEKELVAVEDKWRSKSSGGVIMDPKNGEIYAMANYPAFDPNSFQNEKDPGIFANPIVEHVYEMGSIVKPLN